MTLLTPRSSMCRRECFNCVYVWQIREILAPLQQNPKYDPNLVSENGVCRNTAWNSHRANILNSRPCRSSHRGEDDIIKWPFFLSPVGILKIQDMTSEQILRWGEKKYPLKYPCLCSISLAHVQNASSYCGLLCSYRLKPGTDWAARVSSRIKAFVPSPDVSMLLAHAYRWDFA